VHAGTQELDLKVKRTDNNDDFKVHAGTKELDLKLKTLELDLTLKSTWRAVTARVSEPFWEDSSMNWTLHQL
jgi:hypothetical protein